jgi:hypothetical protein
VAVYLFDLPMLLSAEAQNQVLEGEIQLREEFAAWVGVPLHVMAPLELKVSVSSHRVLACEACYLYVDRMQLMG